MQKYSIGVLTYQIAHRKTWDTLALLKAKGYENIQVFATPLFYQKKFLPLYDHRPTLPDLKRLSFELDTREICKNYHYYYYEIDGYDELEDASPDVYLVCGAGILPQKLIQTKKVVNCHPGYIPLARGLDAFKWAIVENLPLGVTSHIIGSEVDAGEIIQRVEVPMFPQDTFYELAQRQYDYEVYLLVQALEHLDEKHIYLPAGNTVQHRRMPQEIEKNLMNYFEKYKENYFKKAK